jgi:hypothetical protein
METVAKYVKEHKKSSIIPGTKWDQLDETDRPFWSKYFDIIRGYVDEHYFSGENFNSAFNFGSRQRNDDLVYPDETHYDLEVHRTRVVMFTPGLSSVFAFVPDKIGFYREVIEGALDLLDINDHVITPMTHGGEVYGAASEAMKGNEDVTVILGDDCNIYRKGKQYAYDGVNWETQVGTILNTPFHGTKSYFGGMYHVPSGVFDTSLDDTLATLWCYSSLEEMQKGKDVPQIMERSKMDERVGFMLGMAYSEDPDFPRLQGLKLSVDKSDKTVPLPTGRNLEIFGKQTEDEMERWYLGYHGSTPDGGGLLDFLQAVSPEDFRGGEVSQWIETGFPNEA